MWPGGYCCDCPQLLEGEVTGNAGSRFAETRYWNFIQLIFRLLFNAYCVRP